MIRTTSRWLAAAFLGTALLAGCGSSSSGTTGSSTASTSSSTATSSSAPTTTTAAGAQAVAACKQAVQRDAALPTSEKAQLESVCAKAASGTTGAIHKVAGELCLDIANGANVPAAGKEAALAACKAKEEKQPKEEQQP